jgi:hypothetical protein
LPGSRRASVFGNFEHGTGNIGYWWTSTERNLSKSPESGVWARYMSKEEHLVEDFGRGQDAVVMHGPDALSRVIVDKGSGLAVRCIKD